MTTLPNESDIPQHMAVDGVNWNIVIARHIIISLDGVEQTGIVEYNIPEGYIIRYKRDVRGMYVLNDKQDEIIQERLEGVVTVTLKG